MEGSLKDYIYSNRNKEVRKTDNFIEIRSGIRGHVAYTNVPSFSECGAVTSTRHSKIFSGTGLGNEQIVTNKNYGEIKRFSNKDKV